MYLDATTKSLEVLLGGAITTNQLVWNVDYGEVANDNSTSAPKAGDGQTNGATAVTVVAAPGSNLVREVLHLAVQNADTVAQTVTVRVNDNGTFRPLIVAALQPGETLGYESSRGWYGIAAGAAIKGSFNLTQLAGVALTTNLPVAGVEASNVAITSNPVGVGGLASSTAPAVVTAGRRVDRWLGLNGQTPVTPAQATTNDGLTARAWQDCNGASAIVPGVLNGMLNAAGTVDRMRGNVTATLVASGAYTTTQTSADQTNYNGKRLRLWLNVTVPGTGSVTVSLQVKDSISGDYFTVWTAAAAVTAAGDFVYYFADGASGGSFTECLPFGLSDRTWRAVVTVNNANSMTYSLSGATLV